MVALHYGADEKEAFFLHRVKRDYKSPVAVERWGRRRPVKYHVGLEGRAEGARVVERVRLPRSAMWTRCRAFRADPEATNRDGAERGLAGGPHRIGAQ